MSQAVKVRDYMSKKLITLAPGMEILKAINTLINNDIAAAPVVGREGQLIGILTERDCIRIAMSAGYHSEYGGHVADYMSTDVQTIDADSGIVDAVRLFCGQKFHRYPVTDAGKLVGFLSRRDVMRALEKLSHG